MNILDQFDKEDEDLSYKERYLVARADRHALAQRILGLEEELAKANGKNERLVNKIHGLDFRNSEEFAKMKEALKFYAQKKNYRLDSQDEVITPIGLDRGRIARDVLYHHGVQLRDNE